MPSSLFSSGRFLWGQKRQNKTKEEIDYAVSQRDAGILVQDLTWESRNAIRTLVYAVIDADHWRDALDALCLPPPFAHSNLREGVDWTPALLQSVVDSLPPELDVYIVLIPLMLGCRFGQYDARLRAGARRLCAMLAVPFCVVDREEQLLVSEALHGKNRPCSRNTSTEKNDRLLSSSSLQRALKIGGFAALGGVALTLTGGLTAPLIAPAYSAVVAGVSTSVGAVATVGTAVLGGTTAVATGFAALVGTTVTHSAALGSLLLPALSAGNVTAVFGATGAGLAGYKAYNRTGETSEFRFRRVADEAPVSPVHVSKPAMGTTHVVSAYAEQSRAQTNSWKLPTFLWTDEDGEPPLPGLVVPAQLRHVTLGNVAALPHIRTRFRKLVFCLYSKLTTVDLHLKAFCIVSGTWAVGPPLIIPSTCCGVLSSVNRVRCPTGTGFMVCYQGFPSSTSPASSTYSPFRLWLRVVVDSFGFYRFSFYAEPTKIGFDVDAATVRLSSTSVASGVSVDGPMGIRMCVEESTEQLTFTVAGRCVKTGKGGPEEGREGKKSIFRVEEVPQWRKQYASETKSYRRCLHVSVANRSLCAVEHVQTYVFSGTSWTSTSVGSILECGSAMLHTYVNDSWSMRGIDVIHILRVGRGDDPRHQCVEGSKTPEEESSSGGEVYLRLHLVLTTLNSLQMALDEADNAMTLEKHRRAPAVNTPSETEWERMLSLTTNVVLDLRVVEEESSKGLEIVIKDGLARASAPMDRPAVTIAISGYSGIFDPRRPIEDQQLALWESSLRHVHHFRYTEHYVLHWEQGYQTRFAESIHASVLSPALSTAADIATSMARKAVLHGSLFSGFFAYQALMGKLILPLTALSATDVIDNAYATLTHRAASAGTELATALMTMNTTASRPITLVGFSFGASVICHCLLALREREAFGMVENVFLIGCTFGGGIEEWARMREVVAGRFVNVYHGGDWLLWLMQRANLSWDRISGGLHPVHIAGVENVDAGLIAPQHAHLATKLTDILSSIEEYPTEAIWELRHSHGSAGVVTTCVSTSGAVALSMRKACESFAKDKVCQVFRVFNSLVADSGESNGRDAGAESAGSLGLLTVKPVVLYRSYYAFDPPVGDIRGDEAAVFAVVGETKGEIAGCFSVELRMREGTGFESACGRVLFYFVGNNQVMKVGVEVTGISVSASTPRPHQPDNCAESETRQRDQRAPPAPPPARDAAEAAAPSVAVIKKHATHRCSLGLHTKGLYHHAEIPLREWFDDDNDDNAMVLHVSCNVTESSLELDLCGLLCKKSTHLERQTFKRDGFCGSALHHHGVKTTTTSTATSTLPSDGRGGIAKVERLELLQSRLEQVARRRHRHPSQQSSATAEVSDIPPLVILNASPIILHLDSTVKSEWFFNFPPPQLDPSSFAILYPNDRSRIFSPLSGRGDTEKAGKVHSGEVTLLRYAEEGRVHSGYRIFMAEEAKDIQCETFEPEGDGASCTATKILIQDQPFMLITFSPKSDVHAHSKKNETEKSVQRWKIL